MNSETFEKLQKEGMEIARTIDFQPLIESGALVVNDGSIQVKDITLLPERFRDNIEAMWKAQGNPIHELGESTITLSGEKL